MINTKNNNLGKLFVVSASSGAGKTSLIKEVLKRLKNKFNIAKVTTYTTRSPRKNEKNGTDYFFVTYNKFEELKNNGFFLETTKYNGHLYGSPRTILNNLELGKSFILITDLEGAKEAKKIERNAILIWINAPSLEELKMRIEKRGSFSQKQISERMNLAKIETKEAEKSRIFDFIVINNIFEQAVEEIILIIKNKLKN